MESNAPRLKSRGITAKDLAHSSPGLKALGYSGQFNKNQVLSSPIIPTKSNHPDQIQSS